MAAILRGVGGLPFTALRLTMRLLRRLHRGPAPQHLLPVAGLDQERSGSHVWNAGAGRAPEAGGVAAVCDARGQRAPNFVLASPSTRLRRRRCCTPSAGLRGAAGAILYAVCDTLTRSSCSGGWSAKSQATVGELVC